MNLEYLIKHIKDINIVNKPINVEKKEIDKALKGEKIPVKFNSFSTMTVELLKYFTNDKKVYKEFYTELIEKNNPTITVQTTDNIGFKKEYDYSKFKIIDAINWAEDNNKLTKNEIEKLKLLKTSAEFSSFIDKYKDRKIFTIIDSKTVSLPIINLINVITEKEENIYKLISEGKKDKLSIDEFMYALDDFLDRNRILEKYYLPEEVLQNIDILRKNTDIVAINRCMENSSSYVRRAEINKKLKNEILENINPDFDNIESAFYIYYKLCNMLTYDEEQYARREEKNYEINHTDIKRIKKINKDNNRVVCYEFNTLFALFLNELNLKYELEGSTEYGRGHASLVFRDGKYLVRADSTKGLINSDLAYCKNGLFTNGFTLENTNKNTYEEFLNKLDNVYSYIRKTEDNKYFGTARELKKFENTIPKDLDFDNKVTIFLAMSQNSNLPTIDKIPYQLRLRKTLFENENKDIKKFMINYISNKELDEKEKYTTLCLATFNKNGVEKDSKNNVYIAINSNGKIDYLNKDTVEYKLRTEQFRNPLHETRNIPGFSLDESDGIMHKKIKKR